jgi:uncharacterized SAM-binding protein YcdF (DUF218 family)
MGTHILRRLGAVIVVLLLTVSLTPLVNIAATTFVGPSERKPCDAIVVLAAGISRGGYLQDESLRRVIGGITLYKEGLAPILVLSGRGNDREQPQITEAERRSTFAQTMGIPAEAILKEETANTTREEAVRISRLLMHRGLRRILLVTESLHERRSKLVFERAGLEVFSVPSDDYPFSSGSPSRRLWLAARMAQESIALAYYHLVGYI